MRALVLPAAFSSRLCSARPLPELGAGLGTHAMAAAVLARGSGGGGGGGGFGDGGPDAWNQAVVVSHPAPPVMKWRLGGVLQPARQTNTNSKGKKSTVICGCKVACHYVDLHRDLQPLIEKKQIGKETLFGRLKTQGSRKGGYEKWRKTRGVLQNAGLVLRLLALKAFQQPAWFKGCSEPLSSGKWDWP